MKLVNILSLTMTSLAQDRFAAETVPAGPRCPLPPRPRQLYARTGSGEEARLHLATAAAMYCEMGMRHWLEKAEAEIKELS